MKSRKTFVLGTVCAIVLWTVYLSFTTKRSNSPKESAARGVSSSIPEKRGQQHGSEDRNRSSIQVARAIYRQHGVALFTMLNDAYFPFAASWCCNTAAMTNVHHKVLFLTTDLASGERLGRLWPHLTVLTRNESRFSGQQEYSRAGYVRLMAERTRYILHLLEAGIRLLLFEVDAVWLTDPLPFILARAVDTDIVATLVSGTSITAGGLLLLNPTRPTVQLWRRLTHMMDDLHQRLQHRHDSAQVAESDNDQQYFSRLVKQQFAGVRVVYLPSDLFPDGKWYTLTEEMRSSGARPVLINNNWVVGNAAKISRAKAFGHWFWNEHEGSCNSTAVQKLFQQQLA